MAWPEGPRFSPVTRVRGLGAPNKTQTPEPRDKPTGPRRARPRRLHGQGAPRGASRAHEVGEPFPGLQGARARSRGGRGRKQAVTAPASEASAGQCGADSGRNLSCRGHRLPACVCGRLAAARVRWSRVRGSGTLRWSNHRSRLDARLDSAELSFYYRYCFGFGWFCHQPLSPRRKRGCWAPVDQHGGQALLLRTFH